MTTVHTMYESHVRQLNGVIAERDALLLAIAAKSVLPALALSVICSTQGLAVSSIAEVPAATRRAMFRSLTVLFVFSATLAVLL